MKNPPLLVVYLRYLALTGNTLFILWITYRDIGQGFHGTPMQAVSYIFIVFLLLLNSSLIFWP